MLQLQHQVAFPENLLIAVANYSCGVKKQQSPPKSFSKEFWWCLLGSGVHTRCIVKTGGFTRGVCVKIGDFLLNLKVFLWNS